MSSKGIKKRPGNIVAGFGKPKKDQPAVVCLYTGKHILRKRPGLAKLKPAGALKVLSKLNSARP